jgi:hypothetical protein
MTAIGFGDQDTFSVIFYDRKTQSYIIVANSVVFLPDAVAVAKSMKANRVFVIAPIGAHQVLNELMLSEDYTLYELKK